MNEWKQIKQSAMILSRRLQSEFLIERTWDQIVDVLMSKGSDRTGPALSIARACLSGDIHLQFLINDLGVVLLSKEEF